jgi:hypothetical protein
MSVVEQAGKVGTAAVESMKSSPLAIALLLVNLAFLATMTYLLGIVSSRTADLDKTQMDMIAKLVSDIRDCRQGPKLQNDKSPLFLPPIKQIGD